MDTGVSSRPSIPLFVVAAAGVAFALLLGTGSVECGADVMSPGDRCIVNGSEQSYADRVSLMHNQLIGGLVVAVLAFVGAFVVGVLRRRRADPAARLAWEAEIARRGQAMTSPELAQAYDQEVRKERRKRFYLPPEQVPPAPPR